MDLTYIHTTEGRIRFNGGSPEYDYYLKDHLGNTRVVFTEENGAAKELQVSNYYPFGMRFNQSNTYDIAGKTSQYMYNGKELQEDFDLDWMDYGARMYDAALGRFSTLDPLAEQFNNQSPYLYAYNNPVRFTDYMGMGGEDEVDNDKKEEEQNKKEENKANNSNTENENKDEKKENDWDKFGVTKEEWEKMTPEHQAYYKSAHHLKTLVDEEVEIEQQLKEKQFKAEWWDGYSRGAREVSEMSLMDSDLGRGARSLSYSIVSGIAKDSANIYERKVDSLKGIKDSLILEINKHFGN